MAWGSYHQFGSDTIVPAKSTTINFDDIDTSPYGIVAITNGYAKLDWSNMYALNGSTSGIDIYGNSGYLTGATSGEQVAFTGFGAPASVYIASGTFTFTSVEMTSAWNKKETVEIQGFDKNGNVIFDTTVKINDKGPTHVQLDWAKVSEVLFTPLTGKQDPALTGSGLHVVFDDMVVTKIKGTAAIGPNQHSVLDAHSAFGAASHGHIDGPAPVHDLHTPVHMVLA